jgi:thiamine kinase-like enzyme
MIEGLEHALEAWAPSAASELCSALERLVAGSGDRGRLAAAERLPRDRVLRLRVEVDGRSRGLVVKRLPAERAHRERAAVERWLPRVGLEAHRPPLLATVVEPGGRSTWFVYEDLGDCTLARHASDPARLRAVIGVAAELHARFTDHPLLGEARSLGADLGMAFYSASVRDAARSLEALTANASLESGQRALCERLLARLSALRAEERMRRETLEESGGPETLLHGDLWTINVLVRPAPAGFEVRLIDWERAGVGPVSYDLSAFLLRFAPELRPGILLHYQERFPGGRRWPGRGVWNALFDTAEQARIANAVLWRGLAAIEGHLAWALEELAECESAFQALSPVLPAEPLPLSVARAAAGEAR